MVGGGEEEERKEGRCNNDNNDNEDSADAVAVAVGPNEDYGLPCVNNCLPQTSGPIEDDKLPHPKNG
jgi:hypothetical protein